MNIISISDLFRIKKSILKKIDNDLATHGQETSYIAYKIAKELGYDEEKVQNIALLASIHDIGAYKTEEMNDLRKFEVLDTCRHSIYGYILLKHTSLFKLYSSIILYHHHSYEDKNIFIDNIPIPDEAFLIALADRVSILCNLLEYNEDKILKSILSIDKRLYHPEHVEKLFHLVKEKNLIKEIVDGTYVSNLKKDNIERHDGLDKLKDNLIFLPLAIDFFSGETSLHTVSISSITEKICEKLNLNEIYKTKIQIGAYLHDLGKVCTPKHILDKEGKLSSQEYEIMKKHVVYSRNILEDASIDKELVDLACNHHEKLDGTGYPQGLVDKDLSLGDRIITIGDIFCALVEKRHYKKSFSKENVIKILLDMAESGYIDKYIVEIVVGNYDVFLEHLIKERGSYERILDDMEREYKYIFEKMNELNI